MLTFLADAEKARRWILDAMNMLSIVTVVKCRLRAGDGQEGQWRENKAELREKWKLFPLR
jgi:hypothetical protein